MSLHYSASTGGFYDARIHTTLPDDAVAVSATRHRRLMVGQAAGGRIVAGADGRPALERPRKPSPAAQRATVDILVKAEAGRRIDAIAPLHAQLNALRSEAGAADPLFARIDAIRAASDAIRAVVARMSAPELAALDIADPAHWPVTQGDPA